MLRIINAAAEAYRGVIPADCWREPYMSEEELKSEIAAHVEFVGCEIAGALAGVMGIQRVRNVTLIRHAYVAPSHQSHGVGGALLALGLFSRVVAFVLSGEMAFAYFIAHARYSFFPVVNEGTLAVLFCFVFLYLAAAGGGPWSLDALLARRSALGLG